MPPAGLPLHLEHVFAYAPPREKEVIYSAALQRCEAEIQEELGFGPHSILSFVMPRLTTEKAKGLACKIDVHNKVTKNFCTRTVDGISFVWNILTITDTQENL